MPNVRVCTTFTIDPILFNRQRELLTELVQSLLADTPVVIHPDRVDDILGLESLCDAIADCVESDDEFAERIRDEKRGLFPQHEDTTN